MTDAKVDRRTLSIAETGETLGISRQSVLRALERGDLVSVVLGGRRLITVESIDNLLNKS